MRRRDAQRTFLPNLGVRPNGRTLVSAIVSAVLHAFALALALVVFVRPEAPPVLVRITLLSGGGAAGSAGPGSPAPAMEAQQQTKAAPPAPPAPVPADVAPPPAKAVRQRPPRPRVIRNSQRHTTTLEAAVTAAARDSNAAVRELTAVGIAAAGNSAAAVGIGTGTGAGSGVGAGDTRAHCVYCPEPRYPMVARQRGWEGTVRVNLAVGSDGQVQTAQLRQSSGHRALDDAAIVVARQSRFTPPATRGLPTPLHGHIEYRFQLSQAP